MRRILQFGTGRFLRAFVDLFVQETNDDGENWEIIAVQSTGSERARMLARPFHVAIRGIQDGQTVDRVTLVRSVARGLAADTDWDVVIETARDPTLEVIVSNTTEAGLALDDADRGRPDVPRSYPAKLLRVLLARLAEDLPAPTILPCELVEGNGGVLRDLVLHQADIDGVESAAREWIASEPAWCDTLVDRIVSAPNEDDPLLVEDPMFAVAEPFGFWAIASDHCPLEHPAIEVAADIAPYALRKVRILNGAHTALVARCIGKFETVREAMSDESTRNWLAELVTTEIVPCVSDRVADAEGFSDAVFDRFDNPFLDHRLEDIALHQADKVRVRLMPTYEDYSERFGHPPELLTQVLGTYL